MPQMKGDIILEICYGIYHIKRLDETPMIISIDTEKAAKKYSIPIHILNCFLK